MRMLTGVAIDGRVVEMALPSEVALAHLLPDVLAALHADSPHLRPRRVDGTWLDLERSLGEQGCMSGGVVCLEVPEAGNHGRQHDPIAQIVEPPVMLIGDAAVAVTIGAAMAIALVVVVHRSAPVLVALGPCAWALLPLMGGAVSVGDGRGVRRVMGALALVAGSGTLAASSEVALKGPVGVALDACVALLVLAHVGRRRSAGALLRVFLSVVEWSALAAVLPLMYLTACWRH